MLGGLELRGDLALLLGGLVGARLRAAELHRDFAEEPCLNCVDFGLLLAHERMRVFVARAQLAELALLVGELALEVCERLTAGDRRHLPFGIAVMRASSSASELRETLRMRTSVSASESLSIWRVTLLMRSSSDTESSSFLRLKS